MQTYVILRRSAWDSAEDLDAAAAMSTQVADEDMDNRVKWVKIRYVIHRLVSGDHVPDLDMTF